MGGSLGVGFSLGIALAALVKAFSYYAWFSLN